MPTLTTREERALRRATRQQLDAKQRTPGSAEAGGAASGSELSPITSPRKDLYTPLDRETTPFVRSPHHNVEIAAEGGDDDAASSPVGSKAVNQFISYGCDWEYEASTENALSMPRTLLTGAPYFGPDGFDKHKISAPDDLNYSSPVYHVAEYYAFDSQNFFKKQGGTDVQACIVEIEHPHRGNLLNVGSVAVMHEFAEFIILSRTSAEAKKILRNVFIAYGVNVDPKTADMEPYNVVEHINAWRARATREGVDISGPSEYIPQPDDRIHKSLKFQELIARRKTGICVRASLFDTDKELHRELVKYANDKNFSGIASGYLPSFSCGALNLGGRDLQFFCKHGGFHPEIIFKNAGISARAIKIDVQAYPPYLISDAPISLALADAAAGIESLAGLASFSDE